MSNRKTKEKDYYPIIKRAFVELFESKGLRAYFEITANKKPSNELKSKIPDRRQIIFNFLKDVTPDITGYIEKDGRTDFVIIEIKNGQIKLDHIYQARKYADLFEAKFEFLVSTEEIPEEIKRLSKVVDPLVSAPNSYQSRTLVYFDEETQSFKDWYPKNPFEQVPWF
ncbi:hypothetical protein ES703_105962 [subsurface metagenome]